METARERVSDRLDQSIHCVGSSSAFHCDVLWTGSVLIERVTAHWTVSVGSGSVFAVSLVNNMRRSGGMAPADQVQIVPRENVNATTARAWEGRRQ